MARAAPFATRLAPTRRASLHAGPAGRAVLACCCMVAIFGTLLVAPMPVWGGQPSQPLPAGVAAASGLGWPAGLLALGLAVALVLPFRPYVLAVRAAAELGRGSTRLALALSIALAGVALLIYPRYGSDVFVYVAYARLWTVYGENPLLAAPASHPQDWAYAFVWLPHVPNAYGPLWVLLGWPIASLAGTSAPAVVLGYKLLALGAYGGCCWLVWSSAAESGQRLRRLAVFAWSPLVLFETLGKGHNDILLALAALLALRLGLRGGFLAATAGALVKLSGLALLPALAAPLVRARRWRALLVGLTSSGLLLVAGYAPFWHGPETLAAASVQATWVVWSPASLLIAAGVDPTTVRLVLAAVWVVACALIVWRVSETATAAAGLYLASFLLLTTHFFAHYLVPVVALAAVSNDRRLEHVVRALSIGSMAAYAVDLLQLALPTCWAASPGYLALGSTVLLLPLAALLVGSAGQLVASMRLGWGPSGVRHG